MSTTNGKEIFPARKSIMAAATATRKSKTNVPAVETPVKSAPQSKIVRAIGALGLKIGKSDRMTLEESEASHAEYLTLEPAEQKECRKAFIIEYIIGKMNIQAAKAADIFKTSRTERTEAQQLVVAAASNKFNNHISRNVGNSRKAAPKPIPAELRNVDFQEAAKSFLAALNYEHVSSNAVAEVIPALVAWAKTLPKEPKA